MRIKYDDGNEVSYHYITEVKRFSQCDWCGLHNPNPSLTNLRVKDYYPLHKQAPNSYPICEKCLEKHYLSQPNTEIN